VVGFGLSNDERRGRAYDFEGAFRIARHGGLLSAPHGGELLGPASVRECVDTLGADRIGHGVRAVEDPPLLDKIVDRGVTLEVCPSSNVGLGVAPTVTDVPVRALFEAGARIALGADDPLLFGSRLARQYELTRKAYGFSDAELAELARSSIRGSAAPVDVRKRLLEEVDAWLAPDPPDRLSP
jgi:adenosine deaminase